MRAHRILAFALTVLGAPAAAAQDDAAIRQKAEICFACHGPNGNSTNPFTPILAGQSSRYIYIQLMGFQAGRRNDPRMSPMAKPLSRDDMIALGNFFATQEPLPIAFKADGAKVEAGRKTSEAARCPTCHSGGFVGQNEIPRIAGQYVEYVKRQLSDFKAKRRTDDASSMTSVAGTLTDEDIDNLAQYIASIVPR